jgi:hypothetical protein
MGRSDHRAGVRLLQHDGIQIPHTFRGLPAQQAVRDPGNNNARSLRLRAQDIAAILGLLDVGRGLGHAEAFPIAGVGDSEHFVPPKKIAW